MYDSEPGGPRLETCLTHYQMTNFRLFQTERVCRQQFQIWEKWKKVIQTGRKHCGKRRNLVTSNFSFSCGVFKRLVLQTCKNQGFFEKGLINWVFCVGFLGQNASGLHPSTCIGETFKIHVCVSYPHDMIQTPINPFPKTTSFRPFQVESVFR